MLHHHQQQHQPSTRGEITSSERVALTPNKLAAAQHRDTTSSIDNRSLYLESLRHPQQAAAAAMRHGSFTNSSTPSRDSNNNAGQTQIAFSNNQKMAIRNSMNQRGSLAGNCVNNTTGANALSPPHGTILFNTLNGGALSSGNSSATAGAGGLLHGGANDCFTGPDLVDSTTPPPSTAITMPSASNASSSSSTISTNVGLNRSSNGSHDGVGMEKVKTPNSIRGKLHSSKAVLEDSQLCCKHFAEAGNCAFETCV